MQTKNKKIISILTTTFLLTFLFINVACQSQDKKAPKYKQVDVAGINFLQKHKNNPKLDVKAKSIPNQTSVGGKRLTFNNKSYCFYFGDTDGEGQHAYIHPVVEESICALVEKTQNPLPFDGKVSLAQPSFLLEQSTPNKIQKALGNPTKHIKKYDEKAHYFNIYDEALLYADTSHEKAKWCKNAWSLPSIAFLFKGGRLIGVSQQGRSAECTD